METYFAAPKPDAATQVSRLSELVLRKGAAFFATNPIAKFEMSPDLNGLEWKGAPFVMPFIKSVNTNGGNFICGGMFQHVINAPPPLDLFAQFLGATNLIYYDWEITGTRSEQLIYLGQFLRFAAYRAQMEVELEGLRWLRSVSLKFGNCGTSMTLTAPHTVSFARKSSVGFTAFELNFLADWLESPEFPRGLHSLLPAPSDPRLRETMPVPEKK
jgi:hypothetical protein